MSNVRAGRQAGRQAGSRADTSEKLRCWVLACALDLSLGLISPDSKLLETKLLDLSLDLLLGSESLRLGSVANLSS